MLKRVICAIAGILMCAAPVLAAGQDQNADQGWFGKSGGYVAISGGAGFPTDTQLDTFQGTKLVDNKISFNVGPEANIAIGKYFGHYRFEAEFGYRRNTLHSATFFNLPVDAQVSGSLENLSLMGNGYWDIQVQPGVQLYIGGGVGVAREHMDSDVVVPSVSVSFPTSGTDWVLAFQAMTGVSFRVAKGVHLNVGYRYWSSLPPTFDGNEFDAPSYHTAEIGLRFDF